MARSLLLATNATSHAICQVTSTNTYWFTATRSLSLAHNVITAQNKIVFSRHTCCRDILAKSLLVVCNATIPAKEPVISKHTCVVIQEKSLSTANSAITLVQVVALLQHIYGPIQKKGRSVARIVPTPANKLVALRYTLEHILEKNPTYAHNVLG